MSEPLVSVIVPIYKTEAYLDECIQSIVEQTYTNLEIILLDDGSPDNCGKICDEWMKKDARVTVVHKKNSGLSDTRNMGISIANGTYIMMPDSDDYLLPDAIKTMVNYAIENDAQCVLGGHRRLFPDGSMMEKSGTKDVLVCNGREVVESKILRNLIGAEYRTISHLSQSSCMKLYDRKFICDEQLLFYPTKEIAMEDFLFNIQFFCRAHSAVVIPENHYIYRYNPNSITTTYNPDRANALIRLYSLLKKELELSESHEYLEMLAANILGGISVHIKQIVAGNLSDKLLLIKELMNEDTMREMLSLCNISEIKFPLSLFCILMKYRMKNVLYILIKVFLILQNH